MIEIIEIELKNYRLRFLPKIHDETYPQGIVWIVNKKKECEGEAMAIRPEEFEKIIDKYFRKNM